MGSQDWLDPDEVKQWNVFLDFVIRIADISILKIKKLILKNVKNCNKCRNRTCSGRQKAVRNLSDPGNTFYATIEILDKFLKKGRYNRKKEIELARKYVDEVMQTKYSSIEQETRKAFRR